MVAGRTPGRRRLTLVAVTVAALALDIASKVWASAALADNPIALGPLTLRLVHNSGVAFGVGAFLPAGLIIAVTAAIAVVIALTAWRGRLDPPIAAGLIVGGAVANVADRLTAGSVVDFIDIGRWPVFNLADVLLLTGIALLVIANGRETAAQARAAKTAGYAQAPGQPVGRSPDTGSGGSPPDVGASHDERP